jgi:predicted nucleotidyltransferase
MVVNLRMLNKEDIIAILGSNKAYLEKEMGVKRIGLFGSYAKDRQTEESDIDIYVELQDNNDYKKFCPCFFFWRIS